MEKAHTRVGENARELARSIYITWANEAGLKTFRIPRASFADEQVTGRP